MLDIPNNMVNPVRSRLNLLWYLPPLSNEYSQQNFYPWQSPNHMLIGIYCGLMYIVQLPKAFYNVSWLALTGFKEIWLLREIDSDPNPVPL